jgi:hypothetical protein
MNQNLFDQLVERAKAKKILTEEEFNLYNELISESKDAMIAALTILKNKRIKVDFERRDSTIFNSVEDEFILSSFLKEKTFKEMAIDYSIKRALNEPGFKNLDRSERSLNYRFQVLLKEKHNVNFLIKQNEFTPEENSEILEWINITDFEKSDLQNKQMFAAFRIYHLMKRKGFETKRYFTELIQQKNHLHFIQNQQSVLKEEESAN